MSAREYAHWNELESVLGAAPYRRGVWRRGWLVIICDNHELKLEP